MTEVKAIRSADNGGAVLVECVLSGTDIIIKDGKECKTVAFLLLPELYAELKPHKGILTGEQVAALTAADEKSRAVRAGERILGYASNSASQLGMKLRQRGFSSEAAGFAGAYLSGNGEINECRDALRAAERLAASGKGRRRIIQELRAKGYGAEAIALADKKLDEVDFVQSCAGVIRKRYGAIPAEKPDRDKMYAALLRLGFTGDDIKQAAKLL